MSKPKTDNRIMGASYGYTKISDDEYILAPGLLDRMRQTRARQNGVDTVLRAVVAFSAEQSAAVALDRTALWDTIFADLSIKRGTGDPWEIDFDTGTIKRQALDKQQDRQTEG